MYCSTFLQLVKCYALHNVCYAFTILFLNLKIFSYFNKTSAYYYTKIILIHYFKFFYMHYTHKIARGLRDCNSLLAY